MQRKEKIFFFFERWFLISGFVLPGSDIDFNIQANDLTDQHRTEFLDHLYDVLRKDKNTMAGSVEYVRGAKVPIIKFIDGPTGKEIFLTKFLKI